MIRTPAKIFLLFALAVILAGGYFYFSKKPAYAPSENSNHQFELALGDRDFITISSYLADDIEFYLDASECCGHVDKSLALDNLERRIGTKRSGIIFDERNEILQKAKKAFISKSNKRYIRADAVFGIVGDDILLLYKTNQQKKVDFVFISSLQIFNSY